MSGRRIVALKGAAVDGQFARAIVHAELASWMAALGRLARRCFVDRNARGMPERERASLKAGALPHLKTAIKAIRKSRDELRAGRMEAGDALFQQARSEVILARLAVITPYANREGRKMRAIAALSEKGVAGRRNTLSPKERKKRDTEEDELTGLILAAHQGRRPMRAASWAKKFRLSKRTIYRRIATVIATAKKV